MGRQVAEDRCTSYRFEIGAQMNYYVHGFASQLQGD